VSHPRDDLVGREKDIAALFAFVDEAAAHGASLVVSGEPGVGKTALIEAAVSYAVSSGLRLLRVTGAQFEANVSFSGLHQLLFPLLGSHLDQLDELQRSALRSALGLQESPVAPDWMMLSHAALELLTRAARDNPILIVLDDVPWLDQASSRVLLFIARRTAGTRIGLLATMRTSEEGLFDHSGVRLYELGPLSHASSEALLDGRYPALAGRARHRLLSQAQGNPLALLELPIALAAPDADWMGAGRIPTDRISAETLPLTSRLQSVFAGRIGGLPARTRHALLMAVLDGTGDLRVLRHGEQESEADDLAPAERARVISIDGAAARVSFRHPLIRSAIVETATDDERRWVHQILAERHAGEQARRAWHLAEASTGPDESVASLLQEVAHSDLSRGDSVTALKEFLRAADLSPDGADRARRLAEAAYLGAIVAGDVQAVPALMDAARAADPQHGGSLTGALADAYRLLHADGDIDGAHRLLAGAIETLKDPGDAGERTLIEALVILIVVSFFGGRAELWTTTHAAVARLRPRTPRLVSILDHMLSDPARLARPVLGQLDAAIDGLRTEASPAAISRTALACIYVDRVGDCREALWRAVRHGREGGAVTSAIQGLFQLGTDAYFTGRWDDVQALADEGIALCQTYDYVLLQRIGEFTRALVAAARGDQGTSRDLTDQMNRWAAPRRVGLVIAYVWHVRTLDALSRGDFDEAYRCASAVSPAGKLASHVPHALWLIMELVEAAARSRRSEDAIAHVTAAREADIGALSPRLALTLAGAAAMAAPDDEHRDLFERALLIPDADRWPFDLARIQLAYGERLRRTGSPSDARTHLGAAIDAFERLGARPWAARAGVELRATGMHRERPGAPGSLDSLGSPGDTVLTAQQYEIAQLAAAGLSNKQIAERLFLSPRTVGYHLHQVFPKLGVASRAALRDALAALPEPGVTGQAPQD
jgi:DNA-binding CsgD family transcriptional regulator